MEDMKVVVEKYKDLKRIESEMLQHTNLIVERNLQKFTQSWGGTFFVCLPKKWVEHLRLKKGEKLTIIWGKDDLLTIFASGAKSK